MYDGNGTSIRIVGRVRQLVFAVCLIGSCWLGMMAVHEAGHVLGAILTEGVVQKVVLHPLMISSTTVDPNPNPGFVVWFGPLFGCLFPLLISLVAGLVESIVSSSLKFFAGFCLLANGAYIGIGSFELIGDCYEMSLSGTPQWMMILFGVFAFAIGLFQWHRLGSIKKFFNNPHKISISAAAGSTLVFFALFVSGTVFSPG